MPSEVTTASPLAGHSTAFESSRGYGSVFFRRVRRALWFVVLAAIVVGIVVVRRRQPAQTVPAMHYETVGVDRGPVIAKVTASGTLSPLVTVQVGVQVSGRVKELLVDYNSPVTAGQVIARLDPLLFQAAVDQARANRLTAESNLKTATAQATNAERQYTRAKALAEQKLLAQSDFDTALSAREVAAAQVDAAQSGLEVARTAVHQAELNLGYTTITSPIDGTVISRSIDVGQTVAAAFQSPTLFLIAKDLRKMQVDTSVSEADVGRLKTGMAATFTVDAYPGEAFSGTVRQIRSSPTTVQNVVTYDAVIDVSNSALKLKPGMTANVSFVVSESKHVMRVPNAAIRFQPDLKLLEQLGVAVPPSTGSPTVRWLWALRDNRPMPERVELGISDGTQTEVSRGGLHEGDALITDMAAVPGRRFGLF
jgi:HlyD family secretion protein